MGGNNIFDEYPDKNEIGNSRGGSLEDAPAGNLVVDSAGVFEYSRRSAPLFSTALTGMSAPRTPLSQAPDAGYFFSSSGEFFHGCHPLELDNYNYRYAFLFLDASRVEWRHPQLKPRNL